VLHERLDDDSFDAAWEVGEKLSLDEAVALALRDAEDDASVSSDIP
jgi:hypothetical protein